MNKIIRTTSDKILDQIIKYTVLFLTGGVIYFFIEFTARGYSHISMFILGGICFIALGLLNETLSWDTPLLQQMLYGAIIITVLEFITGCIVNLWLGLNVWDYSEERYNLMGQVCLKYSVYWFFLSGVGIILDDFIRYLWFDEEKPRYVL